MAADELWPDFGIPPRLPDAFLGRIGMRADEGLVLRFRKWRNRHSHALFRTISIDSTAETLMLRANQRVQTTRGAFGFRRRE